MALALCDKAIALLPRPLPSAVYTCAPMHALGGGVHSVGDFQSTTVTAVVPQKIKISSKKCANATILM